MTWDAAAVNLLRCNAAKPPAEIAAILGCTVKSVFYAASRHRIPVGKTRPRWTHEDIQHLRTNAHRGALFNATTLGRTEQSIKIKASKMNIPLGDQQ